MQGLNINANPGISFAGKLSHCLKGGMEVAFTFYIKTNFPAANTCLVACLYQRNGWFLAGFLPPWLNIFKGFSRRLPRGFSCPSINISVGKSFFCLYINPIKSSDWTLDLLGSQLPCKVGSSLKNNSLSNKHKWERQGCVCLVLKIAAFKSKCKPRTFLCKKTLPPGCKLYHLQR